MNMLLYLNTVKHTMQ